MSRKKTITIFTLLFCLYFNILNFSDIGARATVTEINNEVQAPVSQERAQQKYPDFAYEYVGKDKFENFNRKMFNLNMKLNKYALKPIHIVWASIMPKYGMDRIQNAYTNIQYPKRLVSSLIQKDFITTKNETIRFLTNSTIGLGGMFDPAEKLLKIQPREESMEMALAKCKVKQGPYLVMPGLASTSPRGMASSLLDNALNPSNYIGTPVVALVKLGFTVNRTYFMQPICKMLESTYADPYDIAKKLYGIENYIKTLDLDRKEILDTSIKLAGNTDDIKDPPNLNNEDINKGNVDDIKDPPNKQLQGTRNETPDGIKDTPNISDPYTIKDPPYNRRMHKIRDIKGKTQINNNFTKDNQPLKSDLNLDDYHPQNPVIDAMRTALFEQPNVDNSIWSEFSIWNRSFSNRIKTASVNIDSTKENYKYRYILQKDKTSPIAIIYPSIGEGINSHHSVILAKMFYDEGYSVIIQGSHFHWEFIKSMPDEYKPGIPSRDADYLKLVTHKILDSLATKQNCQFREKTVIGTSFGAMTTLFLADKESQNNTLEIDKYISINPPIELIYAMRQIDKNTEEWQRNPDHLKDRVAITASKIIQLSNLKNKGETKIEMLPFNDDEAKLITGFVLHQKLSDLIFTIENASKTKKSDIYKMVNNMNYEDYTEKYLMTKEQNSVDDLSYAASLHSISTYLKTNNNYKIYHSMDDYLVNKKQLSQLKNYTGDKMILINNGSHLGFLYRPEFITELKHEISNTQREVLATNK